MTTSNLVNIKQIIPDIVLDIKYATADNFTGTAVYPVASCYLQRSVADKLKKVQDELRTQGLGLKIWDGYRPLAIQKIFWQLVPDPRYVADPASGSKHNRGAAVDVTLVDQDRQELLMPTEFDNFTERAHRNYMDLPPKALQHRTLLEAVMSKHGFVGEPTEWWHFDDVDWKQYPILDIPYSDLQ